MNSMFGLNIPWESQRKLKDVLENFTYQRELWGSVKR